MKVTFAVPPAEVPPVGAVSARPRPVALGRERSRRRRVAVSVVTVTNRPGSIDVTWRALARQSLQDFEWVLCDELYDWRHAEVEAYVDDDRLVHVPAPVDPGALWNLNKSYNEALRHCRGELVVSLQDYIWVPDDGLERFAALVAAHGPKVLVSGVGHGYAPPAVFDPRGKVSVFGSGFSSEAYVNGSPVRTGLDARFTGAREVASSGPRSWELNWGAAPVEALYDIGGFPEDHDREFVSCDNWSVSHAAAARGYRFLLDKSNECHLFDHRLLFPRPGWEEHHGRYSRWERWYGEWLAAGCPRFGYLRRPDCDDGGSMPAEAAK